MKIHPFFEHISIDTQRSCLIVDIDGTLLPDNSDDIHADVVNKLAILQKKHVLYLCSNSKNDRRNKYISQVTKIPFLDTPYKKPNAHIIESIASDHLLYPTIVIGDKYLTDERFANNIHAQYIRVQRKISGNERLFIKLINLLDNMLYTIMKKQ